MTRRIMKRRAPAQPEDASTPGTLMSIRDKVRHATQAIKQRGYAD